MEHGKALEVAWRKLKSETEKTAIVGYGKVLM
jgi:hypothetical protein